jgi:hypothetical protein
MTAEELTIGLIAATLSVAVWLTLRRASTSAAIVELAGLKWTRADFCRGWLITGDTGSGKNMLRHHTAALPGFPKRAPQPLPKSAS